MGTDNSIREINELLEKFANCVPAEGMHIGYLYKAQKLMELYGEVLLVLEDEEPPENMNKVNRLRDKIKEIVG